MLNPDPLWYKDVVLYQIYVRAFCDSNGDGVGDFAGLTSKLDYIESLGVNCVWLMPFYPSPLVDDGYDISDYYDIHPDLGTLEDARAFIDAAHARGIRVISDLVLNHTSDQHRWFVESRSSRESPLRDFYVWSDTDQKYLDARIIFTDTETSNWAFDPHTHQFYFHRFYSQQPDLNYDNPRVQQAMFDVARFWLDLGLDGFRCDAVAYLFEREGTPCENLPETHAFLARLRKFVDENYPGRILLAELNEPPEQMSIYLRDEFHMAFHFPLMPRIFQALKEASREPIVRTMEAMAPIPEIAQWCTFLRNHDEMTLKLLSPQERAQMWDYYAPDTRMRFSMGIRRRLAPLLGNDYNRLLVANSLLFTLTGSPIIYYGDEIGMGDDIRLKDRDGVRTPMQWNDQPNGGFSSARELYDPVIDDDTYGYRRVNVASQQQEPGSLLNAMRQLVALRKKYRAFGRGATQFVEVGNARVLAYERAWNDEKILVINNLADSPQPIHLAKYNSHAGWDVLNLREFNFPPRAQLEPYEFLWLLLSA